MTQWRGLEPSIRTNLVLARDGICKSQQWDSCNWSAFAEQIHLLKNIANWSQRRFWHPLCV